MSFEDQLRRAIEEGKSAAADFSQSWSVCRAQVVLPIFEHAAGIITDGFRDKGGAGHAELKNSTAVVLFAARTRSGEPEYSLTFDADKARREIVCTYEPPIAPVERFDLDSFGREIVEHKVTEFARAVADGRRA